MTRHPLECEKQIDGHCNNIDINQQRNEIGRSRKYRPKSWRKILINKQANRENHLQNAQDNAEHVVDSLVGFHAVECDRKEKHK
jgi:predicted RNase H-like nuclease